MNRNSNVYTVIYAVVLCGLVAVLLSMAALGLKDQQKANTDNEKKQQILMAVAAPLGIEKISFDKAAQLWDELKMEDNQCVIDIKGGIVDGVKAFDVNAKAQFKAGVVKEDAQLPIFIANINDTQYYIMSMYGAGLWDAIWGYVAVDAAGNVVGCSFDHAGETAGLGAKIKDDDKFALSFIGKNIFYQGELASVDVNKPGKANRFVAGGEHVDCITGATKTSDCVSVMMYNTLKGYEAYLASLQDCSCGEGEDEVDACCTECEACVCDSCACEAACDQCPAEAE